MVHDVGGVDGDGDGDIGELILVNFILIWLYMCTIYICTTVGPLYKGYMELVNLSTVERLSTLQR